jgi:predicted dehydrogenase
LAKFALAAGPHFELTVLADLFPDRVQQLYRTLKGQFPDRVTVALASRLIGTESADLIAATDVDAVLLATLPTCHARQIQRLVDGGKHVYAENPVATDAMGLRKVQEASRLAAEQNTCLQVGLQHRFQDFYTQAVQQLHSGIIGTPVRAEVFVTRAQLPGSRSTAVQAERLRDWRSDPGLGCALELESSVGSLDLIQWAIGCSPHDAICEIGAGGLGSHDSVVNFRCPNGFTLRYHEIVKPGVRHQSRHLVYGSHGWCDLDRSKIFDKNDRLIWASGLQLPDSSAAMEQFCCCLAQDISQSRPTVQSGRVEGAFRATSTALLGQMARQRAGQVVSSDELVAGLA